jgi:hypothetical protein
VTGPSITEPCGRRAKRTGQPCRIRVRGGGPCRVHGENGRTRAKRMARIALAEQLAASPRRSPGDVLLEALHLADVLGKRALSEVEAGAVTPRRLREVVDASARAGALARTVLSAEAEAVRAKSGNDLVARQLGDALDGFMAELGLAGDPKAEAALDGAVRAVASREWMPLRAGHEARRAALAKEQGEAVAAGLEWLLSAVGVGGAEWPHSQVAVMLRSLTLDGVAALPAPEVPRSWWVFLARRACAELGWPDPSLPPRTEILPALPRAALTDGRGA